MRGRTGGDYIRRELAGTAFQLCTVGGLILGLLHGLDHPPVAAAPCAATASNCVADGVMAGITPILAPSLGGAVLGMVGGYPLAKLIKGAGSSARPAQGAGGGRWITARYRGRCEGCGSNVMPGDRVFHSTQRRKVTCPACTYS